MSSLKFLLQSVEEQERHNSIEDDEYNEYPDGFPQFQFDIVVILDTHLKLKDK
jgi:hypothetical protein